MKKLLISACLSLAVVGSALAETKIVEPPLPDDLSQWQQVVQDVSCSITATNELVQNVHITPMGGGILRLLTTTELNGKRFVQMDVMLVSETPFSGYAYLKTGEGWLSYDMVDPVEFEKYTKHFADELGVTIEQYKAACQSML